MNAFVGRIVPILSLSFLLFLPGPATGNFFKELGKVLQLYRETDQILWLLGDTGAERRFGFLFSRFYMLTNPIDKDKARNRWVRKVFDRVAAAARKRGFQYRIYITRSRSVNAFALPGGYIFITRGMLDFVKSDDELANVLGHELTHVTRRHALKMLRRNVAFMALVKQVFKNNDDAESWSKILYFFQSFRFSRKNEREADRGGMTYARAAGYDPSGMVSLWQRMLKKYGDHRNFLEKILATHPTHRERIENAKKMLAKWNVPYRETDFLTYDISAASADELLANGGFELDKNEDGVPDGWILENASTLTEKDVYQGQRALLCENPSRRGFCRFSTNAINFDGSKNYEIKAVVKGLAGRPNVWTGLQFFDKDGKPLSLVYVGAQGALPPPGEWQTYVGRIGPSLDDRHRAPAGAEKCSLVVIACRYSPGSCVFDDISLGVIKEPLAVDAEGSGAAPRGTARPNILPNGDFEKDLDGDGKPDRWLVSAGSRLSEKRRRQGKKSVCFQGLVRGRNEFAISELVPVQAGGRYVLEGSFLAPKGGEVILGYRLFSNDKRLLSKFSVLRSFKLGRNKWSILEHRIIIPEKAGAGFIKVWIRARPKLNHRIYADETALFPAAVR